MGFSFVLSHFQYHNALQKASIVTFIEFHVFTSILARPLVSQRIEKERVIVKEKIPRTKLRYIL